MQVGIVKKEYTNVLSMRSGRKIRLKTLAADCLYLEQFFFEFLASFNISVAFSAKTAENELEMAETRDLGFIVEVCNAVSPELSKASGLPFNEPYTIPVPEYYLAENPYEQVNYFHLLGLNRCTSEEMKHINQTVTKINALLKAFFERREKNLLSFRCRFGISGDKISLTGSFLPVDIRVFSPGGTAEDFNFVNAGQLKKYIDFLKEICRN